MKTENKERRVVNLDKKSFDKIKKYCDDNALDMPPWLSKIALEKIETNTLDKTPWFPNGEMSDGTLIFGPCKTKPDVSGSIFQLNIDGEVLYVSLCNKDNLNEEEEKELIELCQKIKKRWNN